MATRLLSFSTSNQGTRSFPTKPTTLLLSFAPLKKTKLTHHQIPIAWKVLEVIANDSQTIGPIEYNARIGFLKPSVEVGQFVGGGADKEVKLGQKTTLKGTPAHWTNPTLIDGFSELGKGTAVATNESDGTTNIVVGLYNAEDKLEPVLMFMDVDVGQNVSVELTPMLRVYDCADYQVTQILRGDVEGFLGEWNLAKMKAPGDSRTQNHFTLFKDGDDKGRLKLISDSDFIPGVKTV